MSPTKSIRGKKRLPGTGFKPRTPESHQQRILTRAARIHRMQRYHVRVNFNGMMSMVCPCCGFIQKVRMGRKHYWIQCNFTDCKAKYVVKITLLLMPPGGPRSIPPDFIIPDTQGPSRLQEAFPIGDMGHWRQGMCTHGMEMEASVSVEGERGQY